MSSRLNPYINFIDGNAREAMEYYQGVFGGKLDLSTFGQFGAPVGSADADKIMHGNLHTDSDYTIMGADVPEHMKTEGAAAKIFTVSISGDNDDSDELKGYWEKLADGGTVTTPLEKQMWGDEFGMLTDRFGIDWMINIAQPQS